MTVTLPSPGEVLFGLFMEPNGVEEKKPITLNRLNLSFNRKVKFINGKINIEHSSQPYKLSITICHPVSTHTVECILLLGPGDSEMSNCVYKVPSKNLSKGTRCQVWLWLGDFS